MIGKAVRYIGLLQEGWQDANSMWEGLLGDTWAMCWNGWCVCAQSTLVWMEKATFTHSVLQNLSNEMTLFSLWHSDVMQSPFEFDLCSGRHCLMPTWEWEASYSSLLAMWRHNKKAIIMVSTAVFFFSFILGSTECDLHWSDIAIYIHGNGWNIQNIDEILFCMQKCEFLSKKEQYHP